MQGPKVARAFEGPGVYALKDSRGIIRYIGETGDLSRRLGKHAKTPAKKVLEPFILHPGIEDKTMRRFFEQRAIDLHGGVQGGQLMNKINSVGRNGKYWDGFQDFLVNLQ